MPIHTRIAALFLFLPVLPGLFFCARADERKPAPLELAPGTVDKDTLPTPPFDTVIVPYNVTIGRYFAFLDTLVRRYDTTAGYPLTEHLLVWANPWIIDTLENTDYYRMMARDSFVYEQRTLVVLRQGDILLVPNARQAKALLEKHRKIVLDLNIPEFKLRIFDGTDTLYTFPVRVGQHKRRYLAMSGRMTDLRTAIGAGAIASINNDPRYINPVDNKVYKVTHRDDGRVTTPPRIPWLEPEIAGRRTGHFIHPTTNPNTLGKMYSNGCVGVREADAWRIYYYAPVGTKLVFRYDLTVVTETGDTLQLRDIYRYRNKNK
ncbi:MAG: L,D-transpeptidase [Saprospiraceae bacterium]|nr:L,D-transpeptidase [Saprospiraceae bacterium]